MARDPKYDVLFEPVQLGPKTLRNRFVQVPHCMGAGAEQPGVQSEFRGMKAEGGWAAVFTELTIISPEADMEPATLANLWDEGDVRNFRLMTEKVHEHGSLAGVELYYMLWQRLPWGHLLTRAPQRGSLSKVDHQDLAALRQMFVEGARRSVDAGFDLITIQAAHGAGIFLQFLMELYNDRTDEYGGSFENRARFSREVLEAVREEVGDSAAVGIRFMLDSLPAPYGLGEDGYQADEGHRFIEHMDDLVDYWDINVGTAPEWGEDAGPSRSHKENFQGPYTADVKQFTSKPVINVGRFTNPDTMIKIIADGQCDLIGAARPSIADPFLPVKIEEGRLDDIRECIGCNMCVARFEMGGLPLVCTQNATSMEEFRRGWHPERFEPAANRDNDVLVVGAGPAGMECARVLGERQMRRVHLVEADSEIGGCMRWIPSLPNLGEWGRVVNYRQIQLEKLKNVEVITGERLTADQVLEYGAEIVVLATGSHWVGSGKFYGMVNGIPGADSALPNVLTPEQVMVDGKEVGDRVLVYDVDDYFMGHSLALKFAQEGKQVTLATPGETLASFTFYTLESPRVNREVREAGVRVVVHNLLTNIGDKAATLVDHFTDVEEELAVDSVVLVTGRESDDELFRELRGRGDEVEAAGITGLYACGDCLGPDFISEAIFSGHRLAREIDSDDPMTALPYIRERRLVGATDDVDFALGSPVMSFSAVE